MIDLSPGATFRVLMTFFESDRDSPRLDLTGVLFDIVNLTPAPWDIEVLAADLLQGQAQLYIPDTDTRLAVTGEEYPFQIRMTFPSGDVRVIPPVVICAGPAYLATSPIAMREGTSKLRAVEEPL